jgi:hypothetical protein
LDERELLLFTADEERLDELPLERTVVDRPLEPLLPELLTVDFDPPLLDEPLDRITLLPVLLPVLLLVLLPRVRWSITRDLESVEREGVSSHRVLFTWVDDRVVPFFPALLERVSDVTPEELKPYLLAPFKRFELSVVEELVT